MVDKNRLLGQRSHLRRDAVHSIFFIKKLADLGGKSTRVKMRSLMGAREYELAMNSLMYKKMVRGEDERLMLTPLGKEEAAYQLGLDNPEPQIKNDPAPKILTPRIHVFKPLRMSSRLSGPIRDGKDDHLQIPSLMGGVRKLPSGEIVE